MKTRLLLLVSGALAIAACGQKNDNAVTTDTSVNDDIVLGNDANSTAPAAAPLTAQAFVNAAAARDQLEIESSKLPANPPTSASQNPFASRMISAPTEATGKLKTTR